MLTVTNCIIVLIFFIGLTFVIGRRQRWDAIGFVIVSAVLTLATLVFVLLALLLGIMT